MFHSGTQVEFFRQHERQMNECQPEGLTQQLLARLRKSASIDRRCKFSCKHLASPSNPFSMTFIPFLGIMFDTFFTRQLSVCHTFLLSTKTEKETFLTHFIIFLTFLYVSHSHAGIMRTCRGVWVKGYLQWSFCKCGERFFV